MPIERVMPPPSAPALAPTQIARQPIYDANVKVAAYELIVNDQDPEAAASTVAQIGLNIVADAPAWVPLTHGFLYDGHAAMLPADRIVFEVDPAMATDPAALAALRDLRNQGFTLAIDPFEARVDVTGLLNMVQAVKIDATLDRATLADHVVIGRTAGVTRVAKNVETHEQFQTCKVLGFDLFQGYFFAQPRQVGNRPMAVGSLNKLRLIGELQDPNVDIDTARRDRPARRRAVLQPAALRQLGVLLGAAADRVDPRRARHARARERQALGDADGARRREGQAARADRHRPRPRADGRAGRRRVGRAALEGDLLHDRDVLDHRRVCWTRPWSRCSGSCRSPRRSWARCCATKAPKGELLHGILAYERGDFHPLLALMPVGVPPADFYAQAIEWATDASGGLVGRAGGGVVRFVAAGVPRGLSAAGPCGCRLRLRGAHGLRSAAAPPLAVNAAPRWRELHALRQRGLLEARLSRLKQPSSRAGAGTDNSAAQTARLFGPDHPGQDGPHSRWRGTPYCARPQRAAAGVPARSRAAATAGRPS